MEKTYGFIQLLLLFTIMSCSESKKDDGSQVHDQYAIDYFQTVGRIKHSAESALNSLNSAIRSGDTVMMNKAYSEMIGILKKSLDEAEKLGPLYDDHELQSRLISLLSFYLETMSGPYLESLELQKKPDSLFTDNDLVRTAQILDSISKAQAIYTDKFDTQLKKSAAENRTIIKLDK